MTSKTLAATYAKKKGFLCGNHVLYCPNLSNVDNSRPFFLYCPSHDIMYEVNLSTQGAEFINEFPNGCRATT